ncbi:hypothetical protein [Nocardia sp. NBC_01327]|uniref:hypothetical protein n=1 Tax=Nocardia sp. NBC_01327 TaxID=2903593 RepID=UPI002E164825|nr:hypothetical protein OG326_24210 [Nocardia sp. NBC_01327]
MTETKHDWPLYANEPERLILRGNLATEVIGGGNDFASTDPKSWYHEDAAPFLADFEVLDPPHGCNGAFLADTNFYQGINAMRVVRRKADDRLFGYAYWDTAGNDGWESDPDSNGDRYPGTELPEPDTHAPGFDWDTDWPPSTYVFLPVEPYTITGYQFPVGGGSK